MINALFELGLEEIPSSEYITIKKQFENSIRDFFNSKEIKYNNIQFFIAPRRFGFFVQEVEDKEKDTIEERRGPSKNVAFDKEGKPSKALLGFLRGAGVSLENTFTKSLKNGEYVFVKIEKKGKTTKELLEENIPNIINSIKFKKAMKWSNCKYEFVRPIHWVTGMIDDQILNLSIFDKKATNKTYGHRFFGKEIVLNNCNEYFSKMKENYVIPIFEDRKNRVICEIKRLEKEHNISVDADKSLIDEITMITEYPTAVLGNFDEKYMHLPEEIITVTVKHHQKSFVAKKDGKTINNYLSFQDGIGREKNIVKGYSRVINARLDDAAFYYDDDLKVDVNTKINELKGITYQKGLGTYFDKVKRMEILSKYIAEKINYDNKCLVEEAAKYSKIDVSSNVVFEFPEMQGVMGRIYLKSIGKAEDIYISAENHYHPVEDTDIVPDNIVSNIISIADRIDDIVGYFCIGKVPSGSKDPFALRRKAFGVIRIIIENNWDINLNSILKKSAEINEKRFDEEKMADFFKNRIETIISSFNNIDKNVINAVILNWNHPLRCLISAKALNEHVKKEEFKEFISAFQRVNNITKNHKSYDYTGRLFNTEPEKKLFQEYLETSKNIEILIKRMDYYSAIEKIISLKEPIDYYFDNVFVMDNDESLRLNKLGFLKTISKLFLSFGDITKL